MWWGTGSGITEPSVLDLGPAYLREHEWTLPVDLKAGDSNGGGLPDLAVINGNGQNGSFGFVRMLPNLGSRAFGPLSPTLMTGEVPCAGAVADFDGEGLDQLAVGPVAMDDTGEFSIFRGYPDGTLAAVPPSPFVWLPSPPLGLLHRGRRLRHDDRTDVTVGCGHHYPVAAVLAVPQYRSNLRAAPTSAAAR